MKTISVQSPSHVVVRDISVPKLGPCDVLVQMQTCGICGSDVEKVFGAYGKSSMRLGHEPAGVIISVGPDVKDFKVGNRVFTHHHVPCYSCHLCNHGAETMCKQYSETNLEPCGLSEQYIVPQWNVTHGGILHLPDSMSFDEAALIEPLACCVRAWSKVSFKSGDSVAIFGVGPTGVMHVMLSCMYGFSKIFCLDVNEFRLDFAKKFDITSAIHSLDQKRQEKILEQTGNLGVDIAIVSTSSLDALSDAFDLVRKGGTVIMFGVPSKNDTMNLDMSAIYSKEITLITSYAASEKDTKKALDLISSGMINVKTLITHRYGISDSQKAFEHAKSGENAMKIIITK